MMRKITGLALSVLLIALSFSAQAQQPKKVPRIGYLSLASGPGPAVEAFRRAVRELGYIEGKNIAFEYRYGKNKLDQLPALADALVSLKVDVLVVSTTPPALAAKNATKTIPIVFLNVSDPIAVGLIDSLARPGGNITGFTSLAAVLAGKRLELLKETVPKLSRVAVLWNPQDTGAVQTWKESQFSAQELGLQLHSMEVSGADKYESAFKDAIKARSAALAVVGSALNLSNQKQIVELAAKNRLPAIYNQEDYVGSGGLMSYGPDLDEYYRRGAIFVDKILKGTKPADIPVEQPTKFKLVINLKAAKQIGLTIPQSVLYQADKVIK
jgi:putative ABC transport system substrate-binding protein